MKARLHNWLHSESIALAPRSIYRSFHGCIPKGEVRKKSGNIDLLQRQEGPRVRSLFSYVWLLFIRRMCSVLILRPVLAAPAQRNASSLCHFQRGLLIGTVVHRFFTTTDECDSAGTGSFDPIGS